MLDLNDLRVFEKVATLKNFTAGARALGLPKSTVSRAIARLEAELGVRLFQRTTREVGLTTTGAALKDRCIEMMKELTATLDYVESLTETPRGHLTIASGAGFGINILSEQLPVFLRRYPEIEITLDLESRAVDLVAGAADVAIRLGPLPVSGLVAVRLGEMRRYLCAAPSYLAHRGVPKKIEDLAKHDLVEMPSLGTRARAWKFTKGGVTKSIAPRPKICVNEALAIYRLIAHGAGLGIISGYVCASDLAAGRLVHVLPQWSAPPVEVNIVFPSRRELSPTVRAFVDFMKEVNVGGRWIS